MANTSSCPWTGTDALKRGAAMTNGTFLATIFTGLQPAECPVVLGIAGAINDRTKWPPGAAWTPKTDTSNAELNWYFTLSTYRPMPDGSYRRIKSQFNRAYGVYCDDLGTKCAPRERLDACPPSYLIETSTGNHQAGYLFDAPVEDLAQVEALIEALVNANLCDPGAKGPASRIGRLPVGHNGKHEPAFVVRLVEWHPERRYTIEQIVERLELEQTRLKGQRPKASKKHGSDADDESDVYRPRGAKNAVLVALGARGLYKAPLGDGKHDITCPWVTEHTNGIDHGTAYFEPNDLYPLGGFKCSHSHGDVKKISPLLAFLGVSFTDAKDKPTIRVMPGDLHRVVNFAERELAAGGMHYQRGGLIVNVVTDPGTSSTTIKATTAAALTRSLSSGVVWERFDKRENGYVTCDPPDRHTLILLDSPNYEHLPVLNGIARQPYLRSDDSLVTTAGFDGATGMFGAFDARSFRVQAKPSEKAARAALAELRALLTEFRFAGDHDLPAALAAILTAAIRPALPVAPMFHFKAPVAGSGKTYLAQIVAAFAGPGKPPVYGFPSTADECEKLLLAALVSAPAALLFDNLNSDISPHPKLCQTLTESRIDGRILGHSKTISVGTNTLFLTTGNNVVPRGDMARRTLTITLDPACESPATRNFEADPLAAVLAERGRFVSLALTIVRAYIVAGRPVQIGLKALGSYGEWSRLVRAPLLWLGLTDPAEALFEGVASDPDREVLGRLLKAWDKAFGDKPTAVREVVAKAALFGNDELKDVLQEIAGEKDGTNHRRLGRWISKREGRVVGGLKLDRARAENGSERWKVGGLVVSLVSPRPVLESVRNTSSDVHVNGASDTSGVWTDENPNNHQTPKNGAPCPACAGEGCRWCIPESPPITEDAEVFR
jgi:hypothetical protein